MWPLEVEIFSTHHTLLCPHPERTPAPSASRTQLRGPASAQRLRPEPFQASFPTPRRLALASSLCCLADTAPCTIAKPRAGAITERGRTPGSHRGRCSREGVASAAAGQTGRSPVHAPPPIPGTRTGVPAAHTRAASAPGAVLADDLQVALSWVRGHCSPWSEPQRFGISSVVGRTRSGLYTSLAAGPASGAGRLEAGATAQSTLGLQPGADRLLPESSSSQRG